MASAPTVKDPTLLFLLHFRNDYLTYFKKLYDKYRDIFYKYYH